MLTLRDLMDERDLGKFYKLQQSTIATMKAKAKANGKWVTGRSASLIRGDIQIEENELVFDFINANHPQFRQLETGRSSGRVPLNLTTIIKQWSRDKGINFATEKERKQFSFAVAYKIKNEGTKQYREGRNIDIFKGIYNRFTENADRYIKQFVDAKIRTELDRLDNNLFN